jgi:L-histidine Nalpha-methyltransferase
MPRTAGTISQFGQDVVKGLSADPRYLPSKYFYDAAGDRLFQKIMEMPEYYLTRAEYQIFKFQSAEIIQSAVGEGPLQLIELGAGDGTKTELLLRSLLRQQTDFTYFPVDISSNALAMLSDRIERAFRERVYINPLQGEYFDALSTAELHTNQQKLILFLGSTIGNFNPREASGFIGRLAAMLDRGDKLLVGFDLKKHPQTILNAYNDRQGITRDFNLNLLRRINRELGGDFVLSNFVHHPIYDPVQGAAKSYLVSLREQEVYLSSVDQRFFFRPYETIFTEISQKFDSRMIQSLAADNGFRILRTFTDSRNLFADVLFERL